MNPSAAGHKAGLGTTIDTKCHFFLCCDLDIGLCQPSVRGGQRPGVIVVKEGLLNSRRTINVT